MSNSDRLPRRTKYQPHDNDDDTRPDNAKRNSRSSATAAGTTASFSDLRRIGNGNRSSSPSPSSSHRGNTIFKNLETMMDSPTASATTFSSSGGSSGTDSPYGSGSSNSPYGSGNGSPYGGTGMSSRSSGSISIRRRSRNDSPVGAIAPRTPNAPTIPLTPDTPATPASTTEASSSSSSSSNNRKEGNGSPGYSTTSRASSMYSEHNIDHTALLLGFHDEFATATTNNNNGCLLGGDDDDDDDDRESYVAESYESDDEREWNACFSPNVSLDELDERTAASALGAERGGAKRAEEDDCDDETGVDDDSSVRVNVGRGDEESGDDEGSVIDIGCATLEDMPVTCARESSPMSFPSVGISNYGESTNDEGAAHRKYIAERAPTSEVVGRAHRPRPTGSSQNDDHRERTASHLSPRNHDADPSATWHNRHGHYFNDDRIEEHYIRKNTNSMERKRHAAKMKALAMKERASSALVAKTQKAKEKVRELKERRQGISSTQHQGQQHQQLQQQVGREDQLEDLYEQHQQQERQQRERPDYGMEITTNMGEPQVFSPVSDASSGDIHHYITHPADTTTTSTSPSLPPPSPLPPPPIKKHHHFKSKVLTQLANAKSKHLAHHHHHHAGGKSVATAASAVSSMKDKASSALSQKANRAKVMVTSSSPMVRAQQRKNAMRNSFGTTGGGRQLATALQQTSSSVSLLSMEESYSDYAPSSGVFANSVEGPGTTITATSNAVDYSATRLELGLFPNNASAIFPDTYSSNSNTNMYATPKATASSKKGLLDGTLQAIEDMHMAETLRRSNVTGGEEKEVFRNTHNHLHLRGIPNIGSPGSASAMSQHPPPLPPNIAACASNLSSHAANTSQISCIDENGFLLSPAASMDGLMDGAGGTPGGLSTALSNVGSESSFDPNSFLFLSPLSNADMDDPDYGMPELLSRSNSRNATLMDAATCSTMTARGGSSAIAVVGGPSDERTKTADVAPLSSTARYGKHASRLIPRLPPSPRLLPPSGKKMIKKMKGAAAGRNSGGVGGGGNDDAGNHGMNNHVTGMRAMARHLKPPLGHRRTSTSTF